MSKEKKQTYWHLITIHMRVLLNFTLTYMIDAQSTCYSFIMQSYVIFVNSIQKYKKILYWLMFWQTYESFIAFSLWCNDIVISKFFLKIKLPFDLKNHINEGTDLVAFKDILHWMISLFITQKYCHCLEKYIFIFLSYVTMIFLKVNSLPWN